MCGELCEGKGSFEGSTNLLEGVNNFGKRKFYKG